jgi:hypothetical protein
MLNTHGVQCNPVKGIWKPMQVRDHLDLTIDLVKGGFKAPSDKLHALAPQEWGLLCRGARYRRWLPVPQLASFAGRAQFLYLAIAPTTHSFHKDRHCGFATPKGWPCHAMSISRTGSSATSSRGPQHITTRTPTTTVGERCSRRIWTP